MIFGYLCEAVNMKARVFAELRILRNKNQHILSLLYSFSTFKQNRCPDGIVNIGYIPFILNGRNVFMSNRGPALRVSSSVMTLLQWLANGIGDWITCANTR